MADTQNYEFTKLASSSLISIIVLMLMTERNLDCLNCDEMSVCQISSKLKISTDQKSERVLLSS